MDELFFVATSIIIVKIHYSIYNNSGEKIVNIIKFVIVLNI